MSEFPAEAFHLSECYRCGYDMRGAVPAGSRCPECGAEWSLEGVNAYRRECWRWRPSDIALAAAAPIMTFVGGASLEAIQDQFPRASAQYPITFVVLMSGTAVAAVCWFRVLRRRHGAAFAASVCIALGLAHGLGGGGLLALLYLEVSRVVTSLLSG